MGFTFNETIFWSFVKRLRRLVGDLDGHVFDECESEPSFGVVLGRATGWIEFLASPLEGKNSTVSYVVRVDSDSIEVRARSQMGPNRLSAVTEVLPPYDDFAVQHIEYFVKNIHRFLK